MAPATELRRWFGAEAGFDETACWGVGTGCPGFSAVTSLSGDLEVIRSMTKVEDAFGVDQVWPARTGNRLFLATVPAGGAGSAYLSTAGTEQAATSPITVSFGIRLETPVADPVVFYRHQGDTPAQTVSLALAPGGRILVVIPGQPPLKVPGLMAVGEWHSLAVTYGAGPGAPMKLYLNDNLTLTAALPLGGPSGRLDLGIVGTTAAPLAMGIDDYVEAPSYDADIRGARINYLMPLGQSIGTATWNRSYPVSACLSGTPDWRFVSEDQHSQAGSVTCDLDAGSLVAFSPGAIDRFVLEGVPSRHQASPGYGRDLLMQPVSGDTILGVRTRMSAQTDAAALTWSLGFEDLGQAVSDSYEFSAGAAASRWGPTRGLRPAGGAWTATSLNDLLLRLDSGSGTGMRRVFEVRLDYVWVPR